MVTSDILASLLGEIWPSSVSPVNIMSGFKKSGAYPLNPGEVADCQLATSKVFVSNQMGNSVHSPGVRSVDCSSSKSTSMLPSDSVSDASQLSVSSSTSPVLLDAPPSCISVHPP